MWISNSLLRNGIWVVRWGEVGPSVLPSACPLFYLLLQISNKFAGCFLGACTITSGLNFGAQAGCQKVKSIPSICVCYSITSLPCLLRRQFVCVNIFLSSL